MRIDVMATSPTYGGAGTLEVVGDFLVAGLPPAGSAVDAVDVSVLLRGTPEAPRDTAGDDDDPAVLAALEAGLGGHGIWPGHPQWRDSHERERQKGPQLVFRRKARTVRVRIVSELSELDVFGPGGRPEVFAAAAHEIVTALAGLDRRVKPDDDIDWPSVRAHLVARLDDLPSSAETLAAVEADLREKQRARWLAMSPWELLDVDWTRYAPAARALLDDPFFWDPADDEAPHGNDEGADLLTDYLARRPDDPMAFLGGQARACGYETLDEAAADDEYLHDALVLGTAFAEIKVTGQLTATLRDLALDVLARRAGNEPTEADSLLGTALRAAPRAP
ncbi:hypothetical protein ACFJIY_09325 [Pimelobacter simplex]|uniref:hypothetical protein n=1 Tax=Nocardioides simplex TaxID=2045 RepID=UPI003671B794